MDYKANNVVKSFNLGIFGKKARRETDEKMMAEGYVIEQEEVQKSFNGGKSCLILIVPILIGFAFPPAGVILFILALISLLVLGSTKKVKVTYSKK